MRVLNTIAAWLILSCCAACGSSPLLVTESQIIDRAAVASIARSKVSIMNDRQPTALKVALVGVNSGRTTSKAESAGRWPGAGIANRIGEAVGKANNANEVVKRISCRALDSAFDDMLPALTLVGLQPVSVSAKLDEPAYSVLLENEDGSVECVAQKARVSPMKLALAAVLTIFTPNNKLAELEAALIKLIKEAGLDGVLVAQLNANGMQAAQSTLGLLTIQPDGTLRGVWQGEIKDKMVQFEPVIAHRQSDDDEVKNVARVFHHSFVLLAARLVADTKPPAQAAK